MSFSEKKREEALLNCVFQLKQQKTGDINSITRAMFEKHGQSQETTLTDLDRLINSGTIHRVEQKGGLTVYIPSHGKLKKHKSEFFPPDSTTTEKETSALLLRCVRELNQENAHQGASVDEINQWLTSHGGAVALFSKEELDKVLEREVLHLKLKRNEASLYVPAKKRGRPFGSNFRKPEEPKKTLVEGKKKNKKSCSELEMYDAPNPISSTSNTAICDYCLKTANCNRKGEFEELLHCKDCPAKAHASCMGYSAILSHRAHMSPWQCIDCKTCCVCLDAGDPEDILFCDSCDKGYHIDCHKPQVTEKPKDKWACNACLLDGVTPEDLAASTSDSPDDVFKSDVTHSAVSVNGRGDDSGFLPTPSASPINFSCSMSTPSNAMCQGPESKLPSPPSVWTIEQVTQYVSDCGFPEQAKRFREQEIDGNALLLLMRQDVLSNLQIKLGPALKIYEKIRILQKGMGK